MLAGRDEVTLHVHKDSEAGCDGPMGTGIYDTQGPVGEDETSDWRCPPPNLRHLLNTGFLRKDRAG